MSGAGIWGIALIDPTTVNTATEIHVYVGGPAGSASAQGIDVGLANRTRSDVATAYPGTGSTHGFAFTLNTTKRGTQPVYVYGINVPGSKGGNPLIGQGSVTIAEPAKYASLAPARLLEARIGLGGPAARVPAGGTMDLQVTGRGGVPSPARFCSTPW